MGTVGGVQTRFLVDTGATVSTIGKLNGRVPPCRIAPNTPLPPSREVEVYWLRDLHNPQTGPTLPVIYAEWRPWIMAMGDCQVILILAVF